LKFALAERVEAIKTVPMGVEVGIPVTHQQMDLLCKYLGGC
jgi:hypothetical protein